MNIQTYGLFYFLEGIAVAFFAIMAVQNLWNRDIRLRMILGGFLLYWMMQHVISLVFTATLHYIPRYNRFLREHYSYDENVNLRWLYVALLTFFALMFIYAVCGAYDTIVGDSLYLAGAIVCWSWICYCIWRQESVLFELEASACRRRNTRQTSP